MAQNHVRWAWLTVSDPEMMRRAGEFREGFTLKVGLGWCLYPWAWHSSQGDENTGAQGEIHMEPKPECKHAQRHVLRGRKSLR